MSSRLKLLLLWTLMLLAPMTPAASGSPHLIEFRSDLWPGATVRDAPLRTVHFYTTGAEALKDDCLKQSSDEVTAFFGDAAGGLKFGARCGTLFVLVHDTIHPAMSEVARRFIGVHETFHIAAQIWGGPTPSVLIYGLRPKVSPRADKFFADLAKALNSRAGKGDLQVDADIAHEYQSLPPDDRATVDYFSALEWPAEYYAFKVMASERPDWNVKSYLAVREEIGNEASYRAAVAVGLELDGRLGSGTWEERVFKGDSMFTLLARLGSVNLDKVDLVQVTDYPLSF
jgi:hypothetical protein